MQETLVRVREATHSSSLVAQLVKESARNAGDVGSILGLGRSPGKGKGYPLQYSGLENSMNSTVHRVAKSRIRLSHFHFSVRPHPPACNLPATVFPCHRRVRRTAPEVRLRWAWLLAITSFPGAGLTPSRPQPEVCSAPVPALPSLAAFALVGEGLPVSCVIVPPKLGLAPRACVSSGVSTDTAAI